MTTSHSNIFLDIASGSSSNQDDDGNNRARSQQQQGQGKLDPNFLSSYFRIPAMTAEEEQNLFSSPVKVMEKFIETRLFSSTSSSDAATDENQHQLATLLRSTAHVLERHAKEAGILQEAAKALFTVLSLSPINDFESVYLPKIMQGFVIESDNNNNDDSSSRQAVESHLLSTESAKQTILSCLPWDRLSPLLAECKKIVVDSNRKQFNSFSDSIFSLVICDRPSGNSEEDEDDASASSGTRVVDFWRLAEERRRSANQKTSTGADETMGRRDYDTLSHLELAVALHTMNDGGISNNTNEVTNQTHQSHHHFSFEPSNWALEALSLKNTSSSTCEDAAPCSSICSNTPKQSTNNQNIHQDPFFTSKNTHTQIWSDEPSPWAERVVLGGGDDNENEDNDDVDTNEQCQHQTHQS